MTQKRQFLCVLSFVCIIPWGDNLIPYIVWVLESRFKNAPDLRSCSRPRGFVIRDILMNIPISFSKLLFVYIKVDRYDCH